MAIGCVIVASIFIASLVAFLVMVARAPILKCPICNSERVGEVNDKNYCEDCGSRWG